MRRRAPSDPAHRSTPFAPLHPVPAEPGLTELTPNQRLRRLELTVTRRLDGLLHGERRGLLPGPGSEPAGSREYRPGEDEVRRMDWSVTARTTVPHVREVDADRELTTWLLVDASASMEYGTAELDKRELAVAAVATVGFLTAGTGNRLGAQVLTPYGLYRVPPRGGRTHLIGLLRALLGAPRVGGREPDVAPLPGPAELAEAMAEVRRVAHRRGLVVVVSDFLDGLPDEAGAPAAWERPLRRLTARHQVLAVEITDPRELELPDVGLITLTDPETGEHREVWTGDPRLRERYAAAAAAQRDQVRQALRRAGATHLALRTDRDWAADIARHVHAQRRLALAPAGARPGGLA
ncbi:DUF58 domain-containing protein [Micromonospora endophytica]|uniref:DUF58 domain-containing protein n=1 Tax=Micromonospora endophytica TaxID=515350 RepID=A0A2W2BFH7_9ACTN|nr:DUF58 domain-containing protein [Micromonospora endophytica]PZF86361.1 DUF58 domain-containing protein [Micromonospora endophytica]RIW45052.1 DUF58 domain-containing protein [Micromonospora endophytica]BCJ58015.1 hypothetical protein Jiend_14370 [Micromonospora endophytica]